MKNISNPLTPTLKKRFSNCKLLALDFDGVLTDNTIIHKEDGKESVVRSRADSQGVDLLYDAGLYDKKNYKSNSHEVDIIIMSRETNSVVNSVGKKIKIKCTQSQYKKFEAFQKEVKKRKLDYSQVLFIGNDLNDIECIKKAGIGVAVADSYPQVLEAADYITKHKGGRGAFREICELLLLFKNNKLTY